MWNSNPTWPACGVRFQRGWQPHQKSNGPCVWTYLLRVPTNRIDFEVGWKALESFSPGLQPGWFADYRGRPSSSLPLGGQPCFSATSPSVCIARVRPALSVCLRQNEKARCPLRDTGLGKARGRLKADVTCAWDTEILRYANLYSPKCQQMVAGNRDARVAPRADSPRSLTNRRRTLSYRSVCNRTSAGKAS